MRMPSRDPRVTGARSRRATAAACGLLLAAGAALLPACSAGDGPGAGTTGAREVSEDTAVPSLSTGGDTVASLRAQADHARNAARRQLLDESRASAREAARAAAADLAAAARSEDASAPGAAGVRRDDGGAGPGAPSQDSQPSRSMASRLHDTLHTEQPRPETEPTVDPEHRQLVEDSATESTRELVCEAECAEQLPGGGP
ncbi:hypothetical protein [Streptomyces sp. JJ36]|uniref:hypothetical protein n=1 Tax=Streptomyces sp. JJ36 TaxID=2736645 RepID=UPI001F402711|nr:hypothetical protein [Streptomyces sp. JJ36]MCF6523621.1 hypothetical protein [Streptomyces sp. JJ36]